ncbi:MAG: ATP-binding protein [Patescibacteria group bacterium]|nr:ATP-binding protein [Patescibacteria group bacterium]
MEHSDKQQNVPEEVAALRAELEAAHRLAERLRQEAKGAERAKNEFLANISHEIRTPMNAILGFCRMLLKESLAPAHIEKLEYVHDAAESLLELMSNVLNYSRLAAGELKLAKAPFELDAVVRDVMIATRDPARHKGLTIDYMVEDSVPHWLLGDERRLGQVLGNLLSNALKFTEHGEIQVRVSLDETDLQTAAIRFVVTDTGVGVPVERQQVIFDAFAQADGSSTRRFGGLGLGLSICKQLIDLMGGQIGFRSTPGNGSSFWITVPLQVYSGAKALSPAAGARAGQFGLTDSEAAREAESEGKRGRFRVLAADDDYLSRTLVEMLLGRAGCLIDTATNGREAVMLASQSQYDLILMDLQMPELDGLTAIRQIRGVASGINRTTPVVALTAHTMPGDCERCLDAGADEYLTKPLPPDALLAVVARFLPGCLDTFEDRAENRASGPRPDPPHLLQEYFQAICRALGDRDFERLETSAGQLKNASLGAGEGPVADHAMRVQFAARSSDLEEAASAVERLHDLLESPCATMTRETRLTGERS